MKKIAFGCDHVDFILKHEIVTYLVERGVKVIGKRTWSSECTDYPYYVSQVTLAVAGGEADGGILICDADVGISIAANKFARIRVVVCSEPYSTQLSRQHNSANVLVFGSRVVGLELTKMIVDAWLGVQYEGGHHQQRVEAIMAIGQQRSWDSSITCMDEQ